MTTTQADALAMATTTAAPQAPPSGRHPLTPGTVLRYVGIAVALAYALFPLIFIVSSAFNPAGTLSTQSLIPKGASGVNFSTLFEIRPYWSWYKNTLIIAAVGTVIAVFIGALAAYAFSRLRFSGRPDYSCCCSGRCSPRY